MQHKLASLGARSRKAHAINDVIETALEHHHQVRAGGTFRAFRLLEVIAELALEEAVGALHLLLLAQLHAVADHLRPARLAVLARNEIALLNRAFFSKTPEAFQEELLPFPAAQPANRFTMSCQVLLSFTLLQARNSKNPIQIQGICGVTINASPTRGGAWAAGNRYAARALRP